VYETRLLLELVDALELPLGVNIGGIALEHHL
jgi:hypothetical protein